MTRTKTNKNRKEKVLLELVVQLTDDDNSDEIQQFLVAAQGLGKLKKARLISSFKSVQTDIMDWVPQ